MKSSFKNIGLLTLVWLNEAGIYTLEELQQIGSVEAYRRVRALNKYPVNLNLLYALEGALLNTSWKDLPPDLKEKLKLAV